MVRVLAADRTAESSNDTNFAFSPDRPSRCLVIALAAAGRGLCCERFFSEPFAGSKNKPNNREFRAVHPAFVPL